MAQPSFDRRSFKQVRVVITLEVQAARPLDEIEEQIKVQRALRVPLTGKLDTVKFRRSRVAVQIEDDLDQRRAARIAGQGEALENAAEGALLVIVSVEHIPLHRRQVLPETGLRLKPCSNRNEVHAMAHKTILAVKKRTWSAVWRAISASSSEVGSTLTVVSAKKVTVFLKRTT